MLARRALPLVLALAVAFAPVALEACQAVCAVQAAAAATGHQHHQDGATAQMTHGTPSAGSTTAGHSCHDAAPVRDSGDAEMTGGPHGCGHSDDLPVTAAALAQVTVQAPALRTVIFDLAPPVVRVSPFTIDPAARDSIPIALDLPLRI